MSIDRAAVDAAHADDTDERLVVRARAQDSAAFELLMRRHNQRIYRVIRSILRDADEIEDVIQQAYLQAFTHLDQFGGNYVRAEMVRAFISCTEYRRRFA